MPITGVHWTANLKFCLPRAVTISLQIIQGYVYGPLVPVRKVSMKSYIALRWLIMCPGSDSGKPFFKIPDKTTLCINDHVK